MQNNKLETGIGALVLLAAIGFLYYAATAVGIGGTASQTLDLKASFRNADGITLGTDVRMAGVKVGSVKSLELNPQTFRAEAVFAVQNDLEIPDDSAVAVASEGLLGGNFIEIIPGGSAFALENGGEILDTQGSVSLISLLLKFVSGKEE